MDNSGSSSAPLLRYKVMWAMVPAMAMVMIDFTIVSISVTTIEDDLNLSATAAQWTVTAYALATAAFVALGGRLGDTIGHVRIVAVGIVLFAFSSLLCGFTPDSGNLAEAWLITFRALEGIGGALLIPSATVLVLNSFGPDERGKGLSIFFIVAGLFTAIGPIAGAYLTEFWTWRAIFWINIPVAIFALVALKKMHLPDIRRDGQIDLRGTVLIVSGMALTVLGIQQSTVWGWGSVATIGSIVAGLILLGLFAASESRAKDPLIDVRAMVRNRPFAIDNLVMFLFFLVWLAIFLFGSMYFQISVGEEPSAAGFSILTVFYPFFVTSRISGGMLDKFGPKIPTLIGLALAAGGMALWASEMPNIDNDNATLWGMLVTGAGLGFVMSPLNTDALNRVADDIRGQASGVVQTVRNFSSALGVALLGTILLAQEKTKTPALLEKAGVPPADAEKITNSLVDGTTGQSGSAGPGQLSDAISEAIGKGFAESLQVAFYAGAGFLALGLLTALILMPNGKPVVTE